MLLELAVGKAHVDVRISVIWLEVNSRRVGGYSIQVLPNTIVGEAQIEMRFGRIRGLRDSTLVVSDGLDVSLTLAKDVAKHIFYRSARCSCRRKDKVVQGRVVVELLFKEPYKTGGEEALQEQSTTMTPELLRWSGPL